MCLSAGANVSTLSTSTTFLSRAIEAGPGTRRDDDNEAPSGLVAQSLPLEV